MSEKDQVLVEFLLNTPASSFRNSGTGRYAGNNQIIQYTGINQIMLGFECL